MYLKNDFDYISEQFSKIIEKKIDNSAKAFDKKI